MRNGNLQSPSRLVEQRRLSSDTFSWRGTVGSYEVRVFNPGPGTKRGSDGGGRPYENDPDCLRVPAGKSSPVD